MKKPEKVKRIFAQLQSELPAQMNKADILECSALIVELSANGASTPRCNVNLGQLPLDEQPLDTLFTQCGWRLVCDRADWEDDFKTAREPRDLINELLEYAA